MVDIGMGQSGRRIKDRIKITEIIVISIILLSVVLLPLEVKKLPQVKSLDINNIGNIGLPQSAVDKLKDLLKP
jgi:hypothetical protein